MLERLLGGSRGQKIQSIRACTLFESLFKGIVTCGIKGGSNQIVDSQALLAT